MKQLFYLPLYISVSVCDNSSSKTYVISVKPLLKLIPYCINATAKCFSYKGTRFQLILIHNCTGDYIKKLRRTQSISRGNKTKRETEQNFKKWGIDKTCEIFTKKKWG